MFQFPGCPPMRLFDSSHGDGTLLPPGFPIRISADQMLACSSPQLIAACYVLLRQSVPWHPPCALISLIYFLASLCFRRESLFIHFPSTSLRLVCFWFSLSLCSFQGALRSLAIPQNDTVKKESFEISSAHLLAFHQLGRFPALPVQPSVSFRLNRPWV